MDTQLKPALSETEAQGDTSARAGRTHDRHHPFGNDGGVDSLSLARQYPGTPKRDREGRESTDRERGASPRVPLTVRLPEDIIERIDHDLEQRDVPLWRNNWLLEAAIEKLRKAVREIGMARSDLLVSRQSRHSRK